MNTATALPRLTLSQRRARRRAHAPCACCNNLRHGALTLHLPDGSHAALASTRSSTPATPAHPSASITLHNWKVFARGAQVRRHRLCRELYRRRLEHPQPDRAAQACWRQPRTQMEGVIYGTWAGRLLYRVKHLLHHNSRANSRKNIHAHYDLGNAFYRLWLDDTMNYSSAWFDGDLSRNRWRKAQTAKVRRALQMAQVKPRRPRAGNRLRLGRAGREGHGRNSGASVVGVTLSTEQLAYAHQRLQASSRGSPPGWCAGVSSGSRWLTPSPKPDICSRNSSYWRSRC